MLLDPLTATANWGLHPAVGIHVERLLLPPLLLLVFCDNNIKEMGRRVFKGKMARRSKRKRRMKKKREMLLYVKGSEPACNPYECDVFLNGFAPATDWLTTRWNGNFLLVKKRNVKEKENMVRVKMEKEKKKKIRKNRNYYFFFIFRITSNVPFFFFFFF